MHKKFTITLIVLIMLGKTDDLLRSVGIVRQNVKEQATQFLYRSVISVYGNAR